MLTKQNLMLAGILIAVYYLYKMNQPAAAATPPTDTATV